MGTPTHILILAYFANFKLAGDRVVRDTVSVLRRPSSDDRAINKSSHAGSYAGGIHVRPSNRPRRRRRGASSRSRRYQNHTRVSVMTDDDLEAELASRRDSRARERERFARSMRSEKLSVLETELLRLRSEISRMDPTFNNRNPPLPRSFGTSPIGNHGSAGGSTTHGTPPNARWESLQPRSHPGHQQHMNPAGSPGMPGRPGGPPPPGSPHGGPPPPPPPPGMGGDDDELEKDPETKKREKEERVRRREAKRKEREAAKKPLTLAEIIRGAGPNPMNKLKPSGSTPLKDIHEPEDEENKEDFTQVSLKKSTSDKKTGGESEKDSKEEGKKDDEKADETTDGDVRNSFDKNSDDKNYETEDGKQESTSNEGSKDGEKSSKDSDGKTNDKISENGRTEDKNQNPTPVTPSPDAKVKVLKDDSSISKKKDNVKPKSKPAVPPAPPAPPPTKASSQKEESSTVKKPAVNDRSINATEALSAITALAAKLPSVKKNSPKAGETDTSGGGKPPLPDARSPSPKQQVSPNTLRRRASLEERRRQRRESAGSNKSSEQNGADKTKATAN